MIIFKKGEDLKSWLCLQKHAGKVIGFVPTMGALHAGHISLINKAKIKTEITVCSIFVNPAQFNDPKDFEKYPVAIENDLWLLEQTDASVLFLPSLNEIYPSGIYNLSNYKLGTLETMLEGYYRPGHFQGVCAVVDNLLKIVNPHFIFLGQKDYQQCMIIKKMMNDSHISSQVVVCPTLREDDGLAMSSRNMRLSEDARKKASAIFKALQFIKNNIDSLPLNDCRKKAQEIILAAGFDKIDYVEICDAITLKTLTKIKKHKPAVALVAAFIEGIRLIDNMQIT